MRVLSNVVPTDEQLTIISSTSFGTELIRGGAGSGKTTTALLRLKSLVNLFAMRKRRAGDDSQVKGLVLTFNRTLKGYIEELINSQLSIHGGVDLDVNTFSCWGVNKLGFHKIVESAVRESKVISLGKGLSLPNYFLLDEVDYVMGRFLPNKYNDYITTVRHGRGLSPRVDRLLRERILTDVIIPYKNYLNEERLYDWNDIAVKLALMVPLVKYDFIITDETQDFSANQIRAINNYLNDINCLTFVLDTAQRVYARGFTWQEAGITVKPENSKRLKVNYRNTKEITKFALPIVAGLVQDDDSTFSFEENCIRTGDIPIIIKGSFPEQMSYVANFICGIDLDLESVAILHPLGGGWFKYIKEVLANRGLSYVNISKESDWPKGTENIALSTMHSSKGLEFDHVIILGMTTETLQHGIEEHDDRFNMLRRLLAMSISRAKLSIIVGVNPIECPSIVDMFLPGTYREILL